MKTQDFAPITTSAKLAENLAKQFNTKVNLNQYDREQLEDIRNKLRTRIFQQEGSSKFNDLLTNEAYQKDKAMLELLNTRIKEMLGEQMKKLRDKMDQLNEAKSEQADKKKCPPMSHIKKMCQDGKSVAEICKMHPDCDQKELKQMIADCKEKMDEGKKAKPDFLDMDKDGDKKEPMKKAVADKKKGSAPKKGVNPFAKKEVKESSSSVDHNKVLDAIAALYGDDMWDNDAMQDLANDLEQAGPSDRELDFIIAKGKLPKRLANTQFTNNDSVQFGEGFPTVDDARAEHEKNKTTDKFDKKELKPGVTQYTRKEKTFTDGGDDSDVKKAKDKAKKDAKVKEASHQEKTTMKHVKNPTAGEKKAAKDIKPGIAGYKDRVDMLKSAEADGRLKQDKLKESAFKHNVRFVNESIGFLLQEDEEAKAKTITAAGDIVNDFTGWMQRIGQYQTKAIIELADSIRADFGAAEAEAFKQKVAPALATSLDTLTQQREILSTAVAELAGEAVPETPMGMEPEVDMDMDSDMGADVAADSMNPEDEFAASDAAAGGDETAGRSMRESRADRKNRKLAESHSILTKLAR